MTLAIDELSAWRGGKSAGNQRRNHTAAREHISRRVRRGTSLNSPKLTREFLSLKLGILDYEVFAVIFLDNRHRLISYLEMFRGTIDGASVHRRKVVKEALMRIPRDGEQCFHGIVNTDSRAT